MYEDEEPVTWEPDPATAAWLQRIADEQHGGDMGRCLAAVTREARIAAESRHRGAVAGGELPADPWQPLDATLRRRSPR